MARAPDPRIEEAKAMYLEGGEAGGDRTAGWICRRERSAGGNPRISGKANVRIEKANARKEREAAQPGNKNSSGGPPGKQESSYHRESLRLSFLIAWNRKSGSWLQASPSRITEQLLLQEIQLLTGKGAPDAEADRSASDVHG